MTRCEFHLHFTVLLFAPARSCLCLLPLSEIEHKCDALLSICLKVRQSEQHGHPAAVLPEVLLLERPQAAVQFEIRYQQALIAV